jgi:hypothetical protein
MTEALAKAEPDKDEAKSLILLYPHASAGNDYLAQIKQSFQNEKTFRIEEANSENEISQNISQFGCALVIFCIRNKEDLKLVLNCTVSLGHLIKRKALRVIGVNNLAHKSVGELLMKRGVSDIFPQSLNQKSLKHKINQSIKILDTYRIRPEETKSPELKSSQKKQEAKGDYKSEQREAKDSNEQGELNEADLGLDAQPTAKPKKSLKSVSRSAAKPFGKFGIKKLAPLTLASDCWLVRKERDFRPVQGRWIVDMIGPAPTAGYWDEMENARDAWQWKVKELPESVGNVHEFIPDEGSWIYTGKRPEFVWDLGRWRFLGKRPELSFINGKSVLATRFKAIGTEMEFAENSEQARAKLALIIKTIENEVRFREGLKSGKLLEAEKDSDKKGALLAWDQEADDELSPEMMLELSQDEDGPELSLELGEEELGTELSIDLSPDDPTHTTAPRLQLKVWLESDSNPVEANPLELWDNSLIVEVPSRLFQPGQSLFLVMDDGMKQEHSKCRLKATLTTMEKADDTHDMVTVEVEASLKGFLKPIAKAFEARQKEIETFMKDARGW